MKGGLKPEKSSHRCDCHIEFGVCCSRSPSDNN